MHRFLMNPDPRVERIERYDARLALPDEPRAFARGDSDMLR